MNWFLLVAGILEIVLLLTSIARSIQEIRKCRHERELLGSKGWFYVTLSVALFMRSSYLLAYQFLPHVRYILTVKLIWLYVGDIFLYVAYVFMVTMYANLYKRLRASYNYDLTQFGFFIQIRPILIVLGLILLIILGSISILFIVLNLDTSGLKYIIYANLVANGIILLLWIITSLIYCYYAVRMLITNCEHPNASKLYLNTLTCAVFLVSLAFLCRISLIFYNIWIQLGNQYSYRIQIANNFLVNFSLETIPIILMLIFLTKIRRQDVEDITTKLHIHRISNKIGIPDLFHDDYITLSSNH